MIEGFQNPALAAGAALAAVPLIIHLLNRQRYTPRPWAAMRFVLAAYRRTKRRVQLENLLLLLARMLAVAALAFAIARPFASGDSPLASLRESRRDLVVAIDTSASTGYRGDVDSTFERIVARASDLIGELDANAGDRVRLILAGPSPRDFRWASATDALSMLDTLTEPSDGGSSLPAAVGLIADIVEEEAARGMQGALELRLLTDLQSAAFRAGTSAITEAGDADAAAPALAEELGRLEATGLVLAVEDHGPGALRPDNLAVAELGVIGTEPLSPGAPFEVAVQVTNHGDRDALAERVALSAGDTRLPSKRVDVPARGRAEVVFTVTLEAAGDHALTAELEGDRLAVDDRRVLVVHVPEPVRILLVNGAPADRIEEDEVGFLGAVLEAPVAFGDDAPSPFEVTTIGLGELDAADSPVSGADVIVLANVSAPPARAVEALEARVAAGAALWITAGDRLGDLDRWAGALGRDDGTGLLPVEPVRVVKAPRRTRYHRAATFDETSPALAYFADEARRPLLTEVPIYDFVASRPLPGTRVLATLDDAGASPLLASRPFGEGQVVFWSTSVDRAWNRIPDSGKTFVPLVLELVAAIAPTVGEERNVEVGADLSVTSADFPRDPMLVGPRGSQRPVDGDPVELANGRWELPRLDAGDLARAGLHEVRLAEGPSVPIAVRMPAEESDLARATATEVEAIHPALRVTAPGSAGGDAGSAVQGGSSGELWRWLAIAALAFLVFESLWGAWIGNRRRIA